MILEGQRSPTFTTQASVMSYLHSIGPIVAQSEIDRRLDLALKGGADYLEASAEIYPNSNGVILRDDIGAILYDYKNYEVPEIWKQMPKSETPYLTVKYGTRNTYATTGFASRDSLNVTPQKMPDPDLTDNEQEVKAIVSIIEVDWMEQTVLSAQERILGKQYDPSAADINAEMGAAFNQLLGEKLISGVNDPVDSPLEFNGLLTHLQPDHDRTLDLTDPDSERLTDSLDRIITEASNSTKVNRRIDAIVCGGAGALLIRKELKNSMLYTSVELTPGVKTSAIVVDNRVIPILQTRWMPDQIGATANDPDTINFYLYDKSHFEWKGLIPLGGQVGNFNPQFFDIYSNVGTPSLSKPRLKQRIAVLLGTPYFRNRGDALYRLKVTAPHGSAYRTDI